MTEKSDPFEQKRTHTIIFPSEDFNDYIIKEEGKESGKDYTRLFKRVNKSSSTGLDFDTSFHCKPLDYKSGTHRFKGRVIHFDVTKTGGSSIQWFKKPDGILNYGISPKIKISVKCCGEYDENLNNFTFLTTEYGNTVTIITNLSKLLFEELFSLLLKDKYLDLTISVNLTTVKKLLYMCNEVHGLLERKCFFKMISRETVFSNNEDELKNLPEDFFENRRGNGEGVEYSWTKSF